MRLPRQAVERYLNGYDRRIACRFAQKLDERILRRELEAMDKAKEEEEKAKNPPKEDVTEDDSKKRRLKDKIKKQKRGEKNGTV